MSDENTDISSRDWARRRRATHSLDGASASANRFRCRSISIVLLAVAWMAMPLAATAACDDYTFEFRAEPSFIAPSVIRVQTRPRSARLSIEIGNKYNEALVLDSAMAQAFCERLKQALAIEQRNEPSIGLDGIQVQGNFKEAASPQVNFSFWSPAKARQPRDFAVVDSIFSLLELTVPSCLFNAYLEQLAIYFSFGTPVRRIAGPPLTLRIYGSLTMDHVQEFDQIVDSLSANAPLLIDMTNFNGMGTLLYPSFRRLLGRTPVVKWKVSPAASRQLQEVGVATADVEVVQGLYCAGQPMRFSRR